MTHQPNRLPWLQGFWLLGASLLGGCAGLFLFTVVMFNLGTPIRTWHGAAFLLFCWGIAWWGCRERVRSAAMFSFLLLIGNLFLCTLLVKVSCELDDLSFDGMNRRIEPVLCLSGGWNPIRDPLFTEGKKLAERHPAIADSFVVSQGYPWTSGSILAAYLVHLTGNPSSGKAVTPILLLAAFGIGVGAFAPFLPPGWAFVLAAVASLNPVVVYQSSSYYVDGHVAALFTSGLWAALVVLARSGGTVSEWTLLGALFLMVGAKASAIFYGILLLGIILTFFLFFYRFEHAKIKTILLLLGLSSLMIPVVWQSGSLKKITIDYLKAGLDPTNSLHGFREYAPGLGLRSEPSRLEIFLKSHFSPTAAMAKEPVQIKFPFWLNRRELAVFEDLSPQPCVGGFGPLYGAFFILSAASLLLIRSKPPWISWLPLIASFGSIYFSQIWWARWIPQAWLIPVGFLLPVICSFHGQPPGKKWILPFLAVFTGLLNSILILAFYTTGCIKSQITLESQLAYLRTLPGPLDVYMPRFQSNRIWFLREGIEFRKIHVSPEPPWLKLHRTATVISLPNKADPRASVSPEVWENWNRRKLVDLGGFPPPGN